MMTPVRRRLAALAMVLLVPSLGACGFGYQTDQVYQPGVGVNDRSGTVDILGAVVVSSSDGTGTLVASLVNQNLEEPATLTNVTGEGIEAVVSAPVRIDPESLVNLADLGLIGLTGDGIRPGNFARLTLTFQDGQTTEINAPVVTDEDEYADVKPAGSGATETP